jgi:hypothetical protein
MTNNQVFKLAHNSRTTGAPDRFKVRRFAPVRQLRQLLYNWQLERRRGPRPECTGNLARTKTNAAEKSPPPPAARHAEPAGQAAQTGAL